MKIFLAIPLIALAGCSDQQTENAQWQDYQIDQQVVAQFHKYSCPDCARRMEGYSKDSGDRPIRAHASRRSALIPVPKLSPVPPQATEMANHQVYDLSQKIAALEEALKTNATTVNANEQLLVQQIVALKNQLAQLQSSGPVAVVTPEPRRDNPSGLRIPGN